MDCTPATRCASPAWTSAPCRNSRSTAATWWSEVHDWHQHHRHQEPAGDPHRHHPGQEGTGDRTAGRPAAASRGNTAAGPNHHPVSDLRRVLRRHQGRCRLGHRHRQAIAARAVADDRSDLPAPERRPRRGGEVRRHRRQTRRTRSSISSARPTRWPACSVIRGDQINRLLVNAQDAAGRDQPTRPGRRSLAGQRQGRRGAGSGADQRQPQPESRAQAVEHGQRRAGQAQGRPGQHGHRTRQIRGLPVRAIASGPFFKAVMYNLLPYQMLQPWVDAAFKKRGIDPENFWRSAGLPAYRWPDPNGTRFPNGAPPPAPPVLEGTPAHPGPAVPPGSPCSYTAPAADGLPRPWQSAALRRCEHRPVRWPRLSRRRSTSRRRRRTRRSAADTGHSDCRAARCDRLRTFRAHRCRCRRTRRRAPAPSSWHQLARRRHRRRSRRACRRATGAAGAWEPAAGTVYQPGRNGR